MKKADAEGLELVGPGGVLAQLTKRVLETALNTEMTEHLGYEKGDPAGAGTPNSRNGIGRKTVLTGVGAVDVDVPRDRDGSFAPQIVRKRQRRLDGFNEQIISLYARGMSVRDIRAHLNEIYGIEVSPDLVSKVTDAVAEELTSWQNRPLDPVWPIVYIDALVVKVRDGVVSNRPVYLAVGVDLDGRKHVLGLWLGKDGEGAKFWLAVLTELRNRGVADVCVVCCDGLQGLPESITATWPEATVQTCVVHLIRASLRYASKKHHPQLVAGLKPIYTASTEQAAEAAFQDFVDSELGRRYPAIVRVWTNAWAEFVPFLAFPPQIRKVIYTTNTIESMNSRLRKATRNRGHFPTEDSVLKTLYLTIRAMTRPGGEIGAAGKDGWKTTLNTFSVYFGDRVTIN
jgi:Transposase and inactivated derivatives